MSTTISTSGAHGVNGDLYASGTVSATTLSGTNIIIGGSDITTALSAVRETETIVSNIMDETKNTAVAIANKIKSTNVSTSSTSYSLLLGDRNAANNNTSVGIATPLNYIPRAAIGNLSYLNLVADNINLNDSATDTTNIKGLLTCDQLATFNGGVRINGGDFQIGNLTVQGQVSLTGGAITIGDESTPAPITVNGALSVNNGLTVNSSLILQQREIVQMVGYSNPYVVRGVEYINITSSSVASNSQNLLYDATSYISENNWISTQITTSPTLVIPDPVAFLYGCELKFFRDPAFNNTVILKVGSSTGGFLISSTTSSTFTLGNSGTGWFKVFFTCMRDPQVSGKYMWVQTYYQ